MSSRPKYFFSQWPNSKFAPVCEKYRLFSWNGWNSHANAANGIFCQSEEFLQQKHFKSGGMSQKSVRSHLLHWNRQISIWSQTKSSWENLKWGKLSSAQPMRYESIHLKRSNCKQIGSPPMNSNRLKTMDSFAGIVFAPKTKKRDFCTRAILSSSALFKRRAVMLMPLIDQHGIVWVAIDIWFLSRDIAYEWNSIVVCREGDRERERKRNRTINNKYFINESIRIAARIYMTQFSFPFTRDLLVWYFFFAF